MFKEKEMIKYRRMKGMGLLKRVRVVVGCVRMLWWVEYEEIEGFRGKRVGGKWGYWRGVRKEWI